MNPHSKPILIENPEWLASKTRICLSTLHWLVCKNPLGGVDRGLSHDILVIFSFTGLSWGAFLFRKRRAIGLILFVHCKLANYAYWYSFGVWLQDFFLNRSSLVVFLVMMLLLLSFIEALPGGTCSLVLLKYWLASLFPKYIQLKLFLLISLFLSNFVSSIWHLSISPWNKMACPNTPQTPERASS